MPAPDPHAMFLALREGLDHHCLRLERLERQLAALETHREHLELLEQQVARQDRVLTHLLERLALAGAPAPDAEP